MALLLPLNQLVIKMQKLQNRAIFQEFHPFYHCCWHAANEVMELEAALDELMEETTDREMTEEESKTSLELQHFLHMNEISAPVFGVTAAESFIYNYGVSTISQKHRHSVEHIDKIDTYSKWILIPALSCGKEIDKNSTAMNDFNQLIKVRNAIIHSKPKIVNNFSDDQIVRAGEKIENQAKERRAIAKKAPSIFIHLVQELLKVDDRDELKKMIFGMSLPVPGISPVT